MKRYTLWTLIGAFFTFLTLTALSVVQAFRPSEAEYVDPFGEFDVLAPGQPTSVLDWGMCDSRYYFDNTVNGGFYCHIEFEEGPFKSIMVTTLGDKISVVWFSVNNLQVGDLVYRWGRPDSVRRTRRQHVLRWNGVYATVEVSGWYTLGSRVKFVAIRRSPTDAET